jgi:hypothetical protein
MDTCKRFGTAFSIWDMVLTEENMFVYYFKTEGGSMTADQREEMFQYYREHIIESKHKYVQIFDMTQGLEDALTHVQQLVKFCTSIRSLQEGYIQRSFLICNSFVLRGIINTILVLSPPVAPFVIVSHVDEAWRHICNSTLTSNWRTSSSQ